MAITVNDVLRLTAVVGFLGQEMVNVHHVKIITNTTSDDPTAMTNMLAVIAAIYANVQNDQSDQLQYLRMEGQNITQDEVLPNTTWPGTPTGNKVFDVLPTQVAPMVFWPTTRLRTRCSSFLPGYTEDANDTNGILTAGALSNLQLFGDQWVPVLAGTGISFQKGTYNRPLDRYVPLVSAVVQPRCRTQRRRRVGVGS